MEISFWEGLFYWWCSGFAYSLYRCNKICNGSYWDREAVLKMQEGIDVLGRFFGTFIIIISSALQGLFGPIAILVEHRDKKRHKDKLRLRGRDD